MKMDVQFNQSEQKIPVGFSNTQTIHGKDGKSAYEIAVENGFEGTEQEWLDSLKADSSGTLEKDYITPEMFGAKGDGVTDDTDALKEALSKGGKVLLQGNYAVRGGITSTASHVVGENAKLTVLADAITVVSFSGLKELKGITLDCNGKSIYYGFNIAESNPTIKNVVVRNIRNTKTDANASICGTYIKGGKVVVNGYTAKDLYAVGNGEVADALGSANGMIVSGYEDLVASNLTFEEIHSIDASGNIVYEDSAGLYIANGSNDSANAVISCVKGKNFGKRLIKAQSYHVSIDNVFATNEMGDVLSFIGILPPGGSTDGTKRASATISNCTFIDTYVVIGKDENGKEIVTGGERVLGDTPEKPSDVRRVIALTGDAKVNNCKFVTTNCFGASVEQGCNAYFAKCEFGVYGIIHHGHALNIIDSTFKSKIGIHSNVTPTGDTTIMNSKMNWLPGDKSFTYQYNTFKGSYFIENSIIEAGSISSYIGIHGAARLSNVIFTVENIEGRTKVDNIVQVQDKADVVMNNVYIDAMKAFELSEKPIKYISNYGKLLVNGMEARDTDTSVRFVYNYSTGNLTVKNTQINRIDSTNGSLSVPQIPYVDELPIKYRYPNGMRVRLKSDDKIYEKVDGEWVAQTTSGGSGVGISDIRFEEVDA
jgi:hypothetical protein